MTDIIIAGGGPVGSCLALLLAESGIDVTLLDAETEIGEDLRASTFHPPTLDMLTPLGITKILIDSGLVCPDWQIRLHPLNEYALFDLSLLKGETDHPFRLQCEQWKLTRALRAKLDGKAEVHTGAKLVALSQTESGVRVEYEQDGARKMLDAKYVIGCDGARSAVREQLGLAFDGITYPETTILATTVFPFEDYLPGLSNVSYCWHEGHGNFTLLKVPGRWRVSIYPPKDVPIETQTTPEAIQAALQTILPQSKPYKIGEVRPYRVHMRIVPQYNVGRVALAGDAAHINSPAGGMGLNGGLHDAFALAEALKAILHGGADATRLDLYDRRRRIIARDEILAQTDRNRTRMQERDPERRRAHLSKLQATARDPAQCKAYLMQTSMIDGLRRAAAIE